MEKVGAWWQGGAAEAPRLAPGVGEYLCEGGKSFQARFDAVTHSAWVRFPDREFRLDAAPGTAEGRYTNGRTTLNTKGEELFLSEGATATYTACKRATAG
ncbi:MAG: MliC family protein [Deltaproteobacteria bacterium]